MWRLLSCVLIVTARGVLGSIAEEMSEVTHLCCDQGTSYARNHSLEDCSSSIPPDVPTAFGPLCLVAMDQCCQEYFQKKKDCDLGVETASSTNQCDSTKDSVKNCCNQCLKGTRGARSERECEVQPLGKSAEDLLAADAYAQCCTKAVKENKDEEETSAREEKSTVSKSSGVSKASLCEEYAPNELCAHHCIPVPGSYKCECNPGYKLMPDGRNCIEVVKNRCKPRNPCQHKCSDNGFEVKCSCRRGYQLMADGKSCEDVDECLLDPPVCLPGTQCHNSQGSYKCIPIKKTNVEKGQCPPGFTRNTVSNVCDDINECELLNPPCPSYICRNTIGGYLCDGVAGDPANLSNKRPNADDRCPPGFKMGANQQCEDVDECALHKDDCNPLSQYCINTRGSFYCQNQVSKHCHPGFKINPRNNKCEDIDECEDGQDICRPDQICVNVPGEYDCKPRSEFRPRPTSRKCPEGMRMKPGSSICEDIDECLEGTHLCDQHQNCLNTNGSHECHCKLGYQLDSTIGACVDINECATDQHNCIHGSQRCDNTIGSFLCVRYTSCGTGYILQHATGQCEDIDECALGVHNCDRAGPEYQCENHRGTFRCVRKHHSTTSTTPLPEYEYEYYDSEEEITEGNQTKPETNPEPKAEVSTTTTAKPPPPPPPPPTTPPKPPTTTPTQPPQTTPTLPPMTRPTRPAPTAPAEVPTERIPEIDSRLNNVEPFEPNLTTPPSEEIPESPTYGYEPQAPKEPRHQDTVTEPSINESVEQERIPETTPRIAPPVTPPQVVFVNVGKETAEVQGEKKEDGSVVVSTGHLPKNEWTKVKERPSDCQVGFQMDDFGACVDIDECATNQHSCSGLTETCRNTMGAYLCDCAAGFRRHLLTGSCAPVAASTSSTSAPLASERTNSYFWGYPEYKPQTRRPFRPRNLCDAGFHFNSKTSTCEDINECVNGQANCATVEICVNTEGGYRCECPPNWRLDEARHSCVRVKSNGQFPPGYRNEPVYPGFSPADFNGGFKGNKYVEPEIKQIEDRGSVISCPAGYKLGYDNSCEDIDECATGEVSCGAMQCTNLPGAYVCSCPAGHKLVDGNRCEDEDECAMAGNTPVCSQNADCINTVGSYQCKCHNGFRAAPVNDKVCVDVDECVESPPGSLCQHRCNNVWGGYRCTCHRGYRLAGDNSTCVDVDECTEFKSKILCIGRCVNEPGSYRCTCPSGYRLSEDKRSCIDIDECETGEAPCANAGAYGSTSHVCHNTRGGYRCHSITCPKGYRLEGQHRCTLIDKICPPADWECAHQPTTYSYNFITFVSKLYIPASKVDLFTMRGPTWTNTKMRFELRLVDVNAPPTVKERADINSFLLVQNGNQAVMSLVKSLEGPQSIELEVTMELYNGDQFGGIAVARLFIYVSEYEF